MNLRSKASAIVVRFRATATNTNMRELALLGSEIASVALKPETDLFIYETSSGNSSRNQQGAS